MKPCCENEQDDKLSGVEDSLRDLFNAQLQFGKEFLKLLSEGMGAAVQSVGGLPLPKLRRGSCCDIPEPCWMPRSVGEISCELGPSGQGTLCLVITNDDFRGHPYRVQIAGADAAHVVTSKNAFVLGAKERETVKATFTVPAGGKPRNPRCDCVDYEVVVWIKGCRNYYVRWQIRVSDRPQPCCYEIEVRDNPDYVLHWYDHFYLMRPCFGPQVPANP